MVDLDYPKKLHIFHNGYSLAPDNLKIAGDILLVYSTKLVVMS